MITVEKMDTRVKGLWLDALRSGDYTQGQNALCNLTPEGEPTGYCCLGVLVEVARIDGVELTIEDRDLTRWYDESAGVLPMRVADWAGLNESCPPVVYEDLGEEFFPSERCTSLPHLNDTLGLNFAQIADVIEASL